MGESPQAASGESNQSPKRKCGVSLRAKPSKRPGGWAWRASPDVPCRHSWRHVCAVQAPPAGRPAKTRPDSRGASTPTAAPFRVGRRPGLQAHRPPPPPEAHRPTRERHENHTNPHRKPYFLTRNLPSGRRPLEAKPLKIKTLSVSVEDRTPQSGKSSRNPAKLCQILPLCAIRKETLYSQPATSFVSVTRHSGCRVRNVETPERGLPSTPLSGHLECFAMIGNDSCSTRRCFLHGGLRPIALQFARPMFIGTADPTRPLTLQPPFGHHCLTREESSFHGKDYRSYCQWTGT